MTTRLPITAIHRSDRDRTGLPGFLGHHAPEILAFLEEHKDSRDRQEELTYWHSIGGMDFPPEIIDHTSFSEPSRQTPGGRHRMLANPHTIGRIIDRELNNPLFPDTSRDIVAFLDIHQLMRVSEGSIDTLLEWAVYLLTNESLQHHRRLQTETAGLFSAIQEAIDSRNLIMPAMAWPPRIEFPLATSERPYLIGCHHNEKPPENSRTGKPVRSGPRFPGLSPEKQIIAGLTGSPETDFTLIVDQSYTAFTRTPYPIPPEQMLASWTRKILDAARHQTRPDDVLLMMGWMIINTAYALMLIAIRIKTTMRTHNRSGLDPTLPFTREILGGPRQWRMPVLALSRSSNRTSPEFARLFTSNWSLDLMVMNKVLEFANTHRVDQMAAKAREMEKIIEHVKVCHGQPEEEK